MSQPLLVPLTLLRLSLLACTNLGGDTGQDTDPVSPARLAFDRLEINYDSNRDGVINPGEEAMLTVWMVNEGGTTVEGIRASLSTASADVTITTDNPLHVDYELAAGEEQEAEWWISVATGASGTIPLTLEIYSDSGEKWTEMVDLQVLPTSALVAFSHTELLYDDNRDGVLNPGEEATLTVWVENIGTSTALGVDAALTTTDSYVTITTDNPRDVDSSLAAGEEQEAEWWFDLAESTPAGHTATFYLTLVDTHGNTWTDSFTLTEGAGAVALAYADHSLSEVSGDGDSQIEPGETFSLSLGITNQGDSVSDSTGATISTDDSHVLINADSSSAYGEIGPGQTAWSGEDYQFTVLASHSGGPVDFTVDISAGEQDFEDIFQLQVAAP